MTRDELKSKLVNYLPPLAIDDCIDYISKYRIKMVVTKARSSKLGDYTPPQNGHTHVITINYNLNKYAFLVTFLHEVAHLLAFINHGPQIEPHGKEWKLTFAQTLKPFIESHIFPDDVKFALMRSIQNLAASSCADSNLYRALKKHDTQGIYQLLENLPDGTEFKLKGYSDVFIKGKILRKRYECALKNTERKFHIHGLAEVIQLTLL
ncbi:MAG: SprT-like domain-containing protein [Bacteroidia bacterium]|nr:SprT-like domain-containing protein [Bacteroidia bacterium]HQV00457.1 SprT-like domain-containing protein [Bacteroidia bacterium]